MGSERTATFGIKVKADTNADIAADSIESLKERILASQDAVKNFNASMRNLRGTSDEVKGAKDRLTAAINEEKDSISRGVLALGAMGTTLQAVVTADKAKAAASLESARAAAEAAKAVKEAEREKVVAAKEASVIAEALRAREARFTDKVEEEKLKGVKKTRIDEIAALRAVDAARAKFGAKKDIAGLEALEKAHQKHQAVQAAVAAQTKEAAAMVATGATAAWKTVASALAVAGAAFVAVGAAAVAAGVSVGKFILEEGNTLRTMNLVNEAALHNSTNALHMAHQIEALGEQVSFTRAELQGMQLDLSRSLAGTRVSGQGIIDTFQAVAQVTDAMGQSAGNTIKGIIERGKQFGRIGIGQFELQGTGITREDVAAELGKNLKGGIDEARQQLFYGMVEIDKGAEALNSAARKKFAQLNLLKMLDINVLGKKFRDTLSGLTSGVNLEPVLVGLQSLSKMFSVNSVSGAGLKALLTTFGEGMVSGFNTALPYIKVFLNELIIGGFKLAIVWQDVKAKIEGVTSLNVADVTLAMRAAFLALADAVKLTGNAVVTLVEAYKAFDGSLVTAIPRGVTRAQWEQAGADAAAGVVKGMQAQAPTVSAAARGMGEGAKNAFRGAIDAHSPSRVFEASGEDMGEGAVIGLDRSGPRVQAAANRMAPTPPDFGAMGAASGGGGAGGGETTVTVTLNFPNATSGAEVQKALTDEAFQTQFTKLLERLARSRGVPTGKAAT